MLRSKSLDNNSYDSGDWFNRYDPSMTDNGFGRGLPPEEDNGHQWELAAPLLADEGLRPETDHIVASAVRSRELLAIRKSTPLFHLGETGAVRQKLGFHGEGPDQTPGVITMRVDDTVGEDVDPELEGLVVVFNATPEQTTQGADEVVRESGFDPRAGAFTVPARTVAVFVA